METKMKNFIGTKLIKARPCTHGDFEKEMEAMEIKPSMIDTEGYLVEYKDGYSSWSPKAAFEDAYMELIVNPELATEEPSISQEMVDDFIVDYDVFTKKNKITIVIATLRNGFTIVESSACVSPENYNESMGYEICKKRIENKVWNHLGFLLQTAIKSIK